MSGGLRKGYRKALERRLAFLKKRLEKRGKMSKGDYDAHEAKALEWILKREEHQFFTEK